MPSPTNQSSNSPPKNPRRVAAGRRNQLKSRGITPAGREALRRAALKNRPWEKATGPKTPEGKARSAANGKLRQKGALSVRGEQAAVRDVQQMIAQMRACRREVAS